MSSTLVKELVPLSVLGAPGLTLGLVTAPALITAIPELELVSVRSPVGSNSTTPNWVFPALSKAGCTTERVGVAPVLRDRPDPRTMSSTLVKELVPLSVLGAPGLTLGLVTAPALITAIPELELVSVRSPIVLNSITPNWLLPAVDTSTPVAFKVEPLMLNPDPKVISVASADVELDPLS